MKAERCWCYDDNNQELKYVSVKEAEKLEAEIERLQAVVDAWAAYEDEWKKVVQTVQLAIEAEGEE